MLPFLPTLGKPKEGVSFPIETEKEKRAKEFVSMPWYKQIFTREVREEIPETLKKGILGTAGTFTPALTQFFKTTGNVIGEGLAYAFDKNVRERYSAGNLEVLPTITKTELKDIAKKTGAAGLEIALYKSFPKLIQEKLLVRAGSGALYGSISAIAKGLAEDWSWEEIEKEAKKRAIFGSVFSIASPYIMKLLGAPIEKLPEVAKGIPREFVKELKEVPYEWLPKTPPPSQEVVSSPAFQKLLKSIKEAKPVRVGQELLYTEERALRAGRIEEIFKTQKGKEAYFAALGELKGELPKVSFEPIEKAFTLDEVDELFGIVQQHPDFDIFRKINTQTGLIKILSGELPNNSELIAMQRIFGEELSKSVLMKEGVLSNLKNLGVSALNVPRALMASADLSATLRQGAILGAYKPKFVPKNFVEQIKMALNEEYYDEVMGSIKRDPIYELSQTSGVEFTGIDVPLTKKEESFMTNLAEKIPLIGDIVKASERAYTGFLNKMRFDVFKDVAMQNIASGITPEQRPDVFISLARFINVASGRGEFAKGIAPTLNTFFFSPRYTASRLQLLWPPFYASLSPEIRKVAATAMIRFVGAGLSVLALAKVAGFKVEDNPLSTDVGKIRDKNIRTDVWSGFLPTIRTIARIITGKVKVSSGEIKRLKELYPEQSRWTELQKFIESKFSPPATLARDLMKGQKYWGEEITWEKETFEKLVPFWIQDTVDAWGEIGWQALPTVGVLTFLGIGATTYADYQKDKGLFPRIPELPSLPSLPSLIK